MGVMIAGLALGAAGGIMGGIQEGQQAKAQYLAQKIEVERANWQGNMQKDRQTEAIAQANTNRRLKNESLNKAAWTNRYLATRNLTEMTRDSMANAAQQARAQQATLESVYTGKIGNPNGGTGAALARQAKAAERRKYSQINAEKRRQEENITTEYKNTLAARDLLTHDQASVFIPGSTGIEPSMTGPLVQGALGGLSSGLSLGMDMDTFATNKGWIGGGGGGAAPQVGPPSRGGGF